MKLSRKLVPAIAMLLVSAVMLSTASFAWFSMNTTVNATGMQVQAQAMGSLIITKDAPPTANTASTTVDLTKAHDPLMDATHDADQVSIVSGTPTVAEGKTFTSGLKTIPSNNRKDVAGSTGIYSGGYEAVAVSDTSAYYVDYICYVSARSTEIKNSTLTLTLDKKSEYYYAGIAADIYVINSADTGVAYTAYKTTLHLADGQNSTDIFNGNILPAPDTYGAASTGYFKVIMRVYIDGNTDAVQNKNWHNAAMSFGVTFTVAGNG